MKEEKDKKERKKGRMGEGRGRREELAGSKEGKEEERKGGKEGEGRKQERRGMEKFRNYIPTLLLPSLSSPAWYFYTSSSALFIFGLPRFRALQSSCTMKCSGNLTSVCYLMYNKHFSNHFH